MFPNLNAELSRYNIDAKGLAQIIGCSEKTARNKQNGVTEFTLSEIQALLKFFTGLTIDYLFETSNISA